MSDYAVINLKTDPELKKRATKVAKDLGISISAVLNHELRRFSAERSVTFRDHAELAAWSINADGSLDDMSEAIYELDISDNRK